MRKLILFLAAQLIALSAIAQLGLLSHVAGTAISYATSPKIGHTHYDTTTWYYAGHAVLLQRYDHKDLDALYGGDTHQKRIAFALNSLQEELDRTRACISSGQCNYVAGTSNFKILEDEKRYFDYSNYVQEYQAYIDIQKQQAETQKQADAARQAEAEHKKQEQEQIKRTVQTEDENTITDFDTQHQDNAYVQAKAERLNRQENRRVSDSLDLVETQLASEIEKQAEKVVKQHFIKKYGAATAKRLLAGELWIGETTAMVQDEYGEPDDHISKTTSKGVTENWSYSDPALQLTFKNHKLATIIQ